MAANEYELILAIGNPEPYLAKTRHNIGVMILEARQAGSWIVSGSIKRAGNSSILVIPLTGVNLTGTVFDHPELRGIPPDKILVIHDDLELPFGTVKKKIGGSAGGHNGLRSIIDRIGPDFHRLRVGIGRPSNRADVGKYVLSTFTEPVDKVIKLANEKF